MIPTQAQLDAMIRELAADGVTDYNEVWDALAERFGGWQRLDFRLRVTRRELDEAALRKERTP
jgi:hypothetical protein